MRLVIEDEAGTRSIVPFAADEIVVGRGEEGVTFRLADRDVSRRHARFVRSSGAVFVEDLGSLTGTRVNGERVSGRRRLREGDLVEIGDYDLAVLPEEAVGPGAPPPLPPRCPAEPEAAPVARAAARPPAAPAAVAVAHPPRRSALPATLVAGGVALALGLAAGWAAGMLAGR